MFGHSDDNQQQNQDQNNTEAAAPAADQSPSMPTFTPPADPAPSAPAPGGADFQLPGSTKLPDDLTGPASKDEATSAPSPTPDPSAHQAGLTASPNDLLRIKQEALQKLSPLVDHLEQTPEERFRTTMMMIQATDDSSKIKDAYDAAQQIEDEKVKAQALLDVVNEINYFSQQMNGSEPQQEAA